VTAALRMRRSPWSMSTLDMMAFYITGCVVFYS
jgi:hypothetical protein